jgi:hypothetical protein
MAALNILAVTDKEINWSKFDYEVQELNIEQFELFPIPKQTGFNLDAIGICLPSDFNDRECALTEFLKVSYFFKERNFELTELYNGTNITNENARELFLKML